MSQEVRVAIDRKTLSMTDGLPDYGEYREAVGYLRHANELLMLIDALTKTKGELT